MGSHACYGVPYPAGPYELRGELERIPPLAIPPRSPQTPEGLRSNAARLSLIFAEVYGCAISDRHNVVLLVAINESVL